MSRLHRFAIRLRQEALRWYEILLCAMLLALAWAIASPLAASGEEEAAVQCGNTQSSSGVYTR
ncbi:MAG TPA: hypothetical protein VF522_21265 [Ramlibacter sp.]|uniref:hypothetical protein n=1 Tax=Ramlibacter sp. TaxID=1917967 RepID=UPI002ED2ABA2